MLSVCHGVQRIIKELAKVAQVVPVNEFLSSKKCATCRNVGHDKKADYLHVCSKTRQVTCRRCGVVADGDVNAATNLVLVLLEYLLHDRRPEHLDAPYAGKYQRACDPADWSTYAVGVPVSAEPPTASGEGDDEGYEDDATAAAAVDMDDVDGGSMWTRGAGSSSRSGHRGAGRDSEQKATHTDGSGAAGTGSRSVTAAATAAAEALNAGGSDSRTARGSKSIFDTFGVTLPKGSGPRDWASSPSSGI